MAPMCSPSRLKTISTYLSRNHFLIQTPSLAWTIPTKVSTHWAKNTLPSYKKYVYSVEKLYLLSELNIMIQIRLEGVENDEQLQKGFVLCESGKEYKKGTIFDARVAIQEYRSIISWVQS